MSKFCMNKLQVILDNISDKDTHGQDELAEEEFDKLSAPGPVLNVGMWCFLPLETSEKILMYLADVDMCGYLSIIAKTNCFKPTERIYEFLCERIYISQTAKKTLRIETWGSWKDMIIHRPRIRTNGFYCLRTLYSRAPCNDAFWEEKKTQSVEVIFISYLNFCHRIGLTILVIDFVL